MDYESQRQIRKTAELCQERSPLKPLKHLTMLLTIANLTGCTPSQLPTSNSEKAPAVLDVLKEHNLLFQRLSISDPPAWQNESLQGLSKIYLAMRCRDYTRRNLPDSDAEGSDPLGMRFM